MLPEKTSARKWLLIRFALAGLILLISGATGYLEWVQLVLLAGIAFMVPMVQKLLDRSVCPSSRIEQFILRASDLSWFPALIGLLITFMLDGKLVGLLTLSPYVLLTLIFALHGLFNLATRPLSMSTVLIACGELYYPVSAIAVGLWKWEQTLFDLPLGIILLTSLHFHYAGFCLPILLAQIQREFRSLMLNPICLVAVGSIPLVGIGIAAFPFLECLSSICLGMSLLAVGVWQMRLAILKWKNSRSVALFLLVSALSLFVSMPMAMFYAVYEYQELVYLHIPTMIRWHGTLNAFGFCLCGLLAWSINPEFRTGAKTAPHPNESFR